MSRWLKESLVVAAAVLLAVVAFALSAQSVFSLGPVTVSADFGPGAGATTLALPPFGSVDARTHDAPVRVELRLEDVAITEIERWVAEGVPNGDTLESLQHQLTIGLVQAYGLGVLAAALTCALVMLAARSRLRRTVLVTALLSAALVAMGAWGMLGFDVNAFTEPTYHGAISYAPGLITTVQERLVDVGALQQKVRDVAGDLASYYGTPQVFAAGGAMPGTIRVLHISDTHLDPVGGALASQLAEAFDVAFVIHTGDINIYGTSVEASAVVATVDRSRPLVFVPGNHDSPEIIRVLSALDNVTVLQDSFTTVAGLRVFGVPDPVSRGFDVEPDKDQMEELAAEAADVLSSNVASEAPDIIALHNPAMEEPFAGAAPIVLSGHTHSPRLYFRDDTWWLNAGTTGGIAFGGPEGPHTAYTAAVLYYSSATPHQLLAIDRIEVNGVTHETSLRRTVTQPTTVP
ncbi:MAG: metallophosphoesterase family protein [Coriobacteriia bacterium]|nr:metallophosphoesterase family protein [Coriobacteriia bacterium]